MITADLAVHRLDVPARFLAASGSRRRIAKKRVRLKNEARVALRVGEGAQRVVDRLVVGK